MVRHLFSEWDLVSQRVRRASALRLFLDFDGTLAALRESPDRATLGESTRRALGKLVRHRRITAAIVSGRRRHDLIRRVRLARVQCWGMYGWERGRARSLPHDVRRDLAHARACLTAGVRQMPGVILEDKDLSLAVHTRGASLDVEQQAWALLKHVLGRHKASHLHVLKGRSVREVLPRQVGGKGVAMKAAIERLRAPFLPIYVGDDATDEAAVAVLGRGITVRVGSWPRTRARYWLADPDEVRRFLERLEGELS